MRMLAQSQLSVLQFLIKQLLEIQLSRELSKGDSGLKRGDIALILSYKKLK